MSFTIDQIPKDVQWVWALQMVGQPVGLETLNKCKEIMAKYPEWFPENPKQEISPKTK